MQVLIVDSSLGVTERLEEIISEAEYITAIHRAGSYKEAIKIFNENKYDAVLLDIDLPGNNSIELLKEIRRAGGKTFVIIMYTHADSYIMKQCKSVGVDFFFDKYYDFEKICGLLAAYHL
jgi:DNA-binding NarL/FixJ family response regulator